MSRPGRKPSPLEWPLEKYEKALALRATGICNREIAERLGVTLGALNMKLYNMRRAAQFQSNGWSAADDDLLIDLHGVRKLEWRAIAPYFRGRSTVECRDRYHYLTKARDKETTPRVRLRERKADGRIHYTAQDLALIQQQRIAEPLRYASPFSEMLGEPPIGRRAIDRKPTGAGA